ncbi:MAG: hypothetical protein CME65_03090 [Halobacteriovoraceae bacterium]|nr:hypothetical protein [Halobacteriovoraceae bacterium]|tara:strand:- start:3399 stop:4166 length:768 start_codon:yes stop_codon:yes gene_type:complete
MKCKAYLVADSIDISALPNEMKVKETCFFQVDGNRYVVFPYGVIVCWGDGHLAPALVLIQPHLREPYGEKLIQTDEFIVEKQENGQTKLIMEDTIFLPSFEDVVYTAFSHPIAQSLRLIKFEDEILASVSHFIHIPASLAKHGKIKESKKQISKMQGHLYSLKSLIRLEHSVLDKPEFFWEYPEFDDYYNRMAIYLEMNSRLTIMDKKFETIDEILSILSNELNHRHSSKLEWIIILLILIEIIIFFVQDVLKLI